MSRVTEEEIARISAGRVSPTPEDVEIFRRNLNRIMRQIPTSRDLRGLTALKNACKDYLEFKP